MPKIMYLIYGLDILCHGSLHILASEQVNPRGEQEKFFVAYCSYKNLNFTNIGHTNMNNA